ncbi:MAG: FAD:protein FMN transferase [Rikenellaceae bacterium]|nr:FAD:protein FMN transferase [Rikenellaceae bacterium]
MRILYIIIVATAMLSGCAGEQKPVRHEINGLAQGTTYHIVYNHPEPIVGVYHTDSILRLFDKSCSLWDSTSLISRINRNETDTVDRNIKECIELALRLSRESDGLYDITVAPLAEAYGFGAGERIGRPDIDSIMQFVGHDKINLAGRIITKSDPRVRIDLNSIAQGYSADILARYLERQGIRDYLVEVGGEIICSASNDGKPWRVGIDRPVEGNYSPGADLQVILALSSEGLATSGNYRKFYTDENGRPVHHSIDPTTGMSTVNEMLSATVVAPSAIEADAYATLMMVSGLEGSRRILDRNKKLAAYIVYAAEDGSMRVFVSDNMQSRIVEQD